MHRPEAFEGKTIDVPGDPALAGLAALLDPEWMGQAISSQLLRAGNRLSRCRPVYVRYKPATSCIVAFQVEYATGSGESAVLWCYGKCHVREDFKRAVAKATSRDLIGNQEIRPHGFMAAEGIVLHAFPNDAELPGLRLVASPKKLQRLLYEHYARLPEAEWRVSDSRLWVTTVRYKPEKRVLNRVDTRAVNRRTGEKTPVRVFLRTRHDDRGAEIFTIMKHLHDSLGDRPYFVVPEPVAYLPDRCTLIVENVAGTPLTELLIKGNSGTAVALSGTALARLHGHAANAATSRTTDDLLADARDNCRSLTHILPEMEREFVGTLKRIEEGIRTLELGSTRFVHGDFYHDQLLVHEDRVAILDFDRSHAGDPVEDIGNFKAHLLYLEIMGESLDAQQLADRFERAYENTAEARIDRDRLRFWTALGLFQLAVKPFRSLVPRWPGRSASVLAECRRILS